MAGEKNAGSIVYEISADVEPLLQGGKQASASLDGMERAADRASAGFKRVRPQGRSSTAATLRYQLSPGSYTSRRWTSTQTPPR